MSAVGFESPETIESRASPEQSSSSETRHDGPRNKKDAHRGESKP